MILNLSFGSFDKFWYQVAIFMMSFYLLADMLTGFSIIYLGVDLKISLLYKTPIFFLLLILVMSNKPKLGVGILSLLLFFLIGPIFTFLDNSIIKYLVLDLTTVVKLFTPVLVFFFFKVLYQLYPSLAVNGINSILKVSFVILSFNFILGALGIGKSTYNLGDDKGAGSTGLIMAGNEVGATFLVIFGFALFKVWEIKRGSIHYFLLSLFTLFCGLVVSTKTTMLAAVLLIFLVPLVSERNKLFKLTKLKLKIFIPLIASAIGVVWMIIDILESLGLYGRFLWFYEKKGFLGIILSGRDIMVAEKIGIYLNDLGYVNQVFGSGQYIAEKSLSLAATTEVDSVDVYMYYGIFALLLTAFFYLITNIIALKLTLKSSSKYAPIVFLVSFLLLLLSQLSGHIWMSGTLALAFGAFLSLLHRDIKINNSATRIR